MAYFIIILVNMMWIESCKLLLLTGLLAHNVVYGNHPGKDIVEASL